MGIVCPLFPINSYLIQVVAGGVELYHAIGVCVHHPDIAAGVYSYVPRIGEKVILCASQAGRADGHLEGAGGVVLEHPVAIVVGYPEVAGAIEANAIGIVEVVGIGQVGHFRHPKRLHIPKNCPRLTHGDIRRPRRALAGRGFLCHRPGSYHQQRHQHCHTDQSIPFVHFGSPFIFSS